jgi:hypothetical protein
VYSEGLGFAETSQASVTAVISRGKPDRREDDLTAEAIGHTEPYTATIYVEYHIDVINHRDIRHRAGIIHARKIPRIFHRIQSKPVSTARGSR